MPFYEYQCRACGELTEVLQKVSDAPLRKCPACGKNQLNKLISAPVFRLKGSGWYETDFKSEGDKKRNLVGEDKEEAKPAAPAETKAESKDKPAEAATKPEATAAAPKAKPVKSKAKPKAAPRKAAGKRR
ncbi:MAG: FmdB family zinc ribbon protein [Steroidobacteraceae bacterium]